jgi:dolichyl-phosphate-mannose-protein mannosyltransferase
VNETVPPEIVAPPDVDAARPWWRRREFLIPLLIVVAAGVVRLIALGRPGTLIPLDEQHYVPDARQILRHGFENHFIVHPEIGKWFIAAGIKIFGDHPFGWRFFGAVFGTFGVLLVYLIALRLWSSRLLAAAAAILLSVEGLWFVQSRVAMLDVYMSTFMLLGVWLLVEDRARWTPDRAGVRWWRLGAGFAFGLAFASKFLAIAPFLLGTAALAAVGIGGGLHRWRLGSRGAAVREVAKIGGTFVLLPVLIYTATWYPWFLQKNRYEPPRCQASTNRFATWACYQKEIFEFHQHLAKYEAKGGVGHPYFGEAWSWPWIGRPVAHFYTTTGSGAAQQDREVLGVPNPAIWWPAFSLGIPLLGWWWLRRRDQRAGFIMLFLVLGWVPFLVTGAFGRPIFFFYATPMVPFLTLAVLHVLYRLFHGWRYERRVVVGYVAIAIAIFGYFYPVLAGVQIPHDGATGWRAHMWLRSDCLSSGIKHACWI